MNSFELDKVKLNLTPQELEDLIKKYYLTLDESIKEIEIVWHNNWISGTYDSFWEREIGGYHDFYFEVKIKREIKALEKTQVIDNSFTVNKSDLKEILQGILLKDNLIIDFIYLSLFQDNKIDVSCHKLNKETELSKQNDVTLVPQALIIPDSVFMETLYNLYNIGDKAINKIQDTITKVLKL